MRLSRFFPAALLAVATAFGAPATAHAQGADERSGWGFQVGFYGWLPTFDARLNYTLPRGVPGTANVKAESNDYLSDLNAAVMLSAEARYDRISLVTDFIYVGLGSSSSRVRSANPSPLANNPVTSVQTLSAAITASSSSVSGRAMSHMWRCRRPSVFMMSQVQPSSA